MAEKKETKARKPISKGKAAPAQPEAQAAVPGKAQSREPAWGKAEETGEPEPAEAEQLQSHETAEPEPDETVTPESTSLEAESQPSPGSLQESAALARQASPEAPAGEQSRQQGEGQSGRKPVAAGGQAQARKPGEPIVKRAPHESRPPSEEEEDSAPRSKRRGRADASARRQIEDMRGRAESEWEEKIIQVRRVTKVVKGGKKLSFRAVVAVGNGKGQVGIGIGKAAEVIGAIQKGIVDAKKNLTSVPLIGSTIPHQVLGRQGSSRIIIKPAARGTGIIAGGAARAILELAGIGDVLAKSLGSRSPLNVSRATINGLKELRTFETAARLRGISLKQLLTG